VALCEPANFELLEPINVIQERQIASGQRVDQSRARAEHAALTEALRGQGVEVLLVGPEARLPYQINTRDAGLGTPGGVILGRLRLSIRQGEERLLEQALLAAGQTPRGRTRAAFEGGDFMAITPWLGALGLGERTEPAAQAELGALLGPGVELIGVPFEGRYLHLDMIFNQLAERLALACPAALPARFLRRLEQEQVRLIEVDEQEVFHHACNVLPLGPASVLSHTGNARVNDLLRAEGFRLTVVDVTELARGGGGPRCLTMPVERQAAS
jgi:N-dimethylarginine dimethylaminohydrolase